MKIIDPWKRPNQVERNRVRAGGLSIAFAGPARHGFLEREGSELISWFHVSLVHIPLEELRKRPYSGAQYFLAEPRHDTISSNGIR